MGRNDSILECFQGVDGREGLPEDLFIAISMVMPIANVDLLILDEYKRILLSWREDVYFGKGWHLPGGCIRYKETMVERIQKTALNEIGTEVIIEPEPIAVRDVIMGKDNNRIRKRAHHLAILYSCYLPDDFILGDRVEEQLKLKKLKWFGRIPDDILSVHAVYNDVFHRYGLI